jgi:glycosyltransferase involved in cell wall biosynthesis
LLEALAILRDAQNVIVPLVVSGYQNDFYATIKARVEELRLTQQVRFVGYLNERQVRALYNTCKLVVVATKFDPASLPIWEGFEAGRPVVCSNVTPLMRQTAGAAAVFDPESPREMAKVIGQVWLDPALQDALVVKGTARIRQFSWDQTARHFRALYRAALSRPLSEEDRHLLATEPVI